MAAASAASPSCIAIVVVGRIVKRAVAVVYPSAASASPAARLARGTAPCVIIVGLIVVVIKSNVVLFIGVAPRTAAVVVAGGSWWKGDSISV